MSDSSVAGEPPAASGDASPATALLLLRPLSAFFSEPLAERFSLLKPWESALPLPDFLAAHASQVRALLVSGPASVDQDTLDALPRLGLVVTTSAGLDHIDLAECRRRGVAVANAGEVFSEDTADLAVGLVLDVLRRVSAANRFVRRGLWPANEEYPLGSKLGGKRVGIVGLGSIGFKIARRLEAFGCPISYNSRGRKPSLPYVYFTDVCDLAANSDVLIVSCALTSETHHIINKKVMDALGKNGILINVGRGALVDEKELVKHLTQGEICGAGLDVFEDEPVVPRELFLLDNVVLSPHSGFSTRESFSDLRQLIIANLEAFFSNRPLLTPVGEC